MHTPRLAPDLLAARARAEKLVEQMVRGGVTLVALPEMLVEEHAWKSTLAARADAH